MVGETDLSELLRTMRPELKAEEFVFCTVPSDQLSKLAVRPVSLFYEQEGISLILSRPQADRQKISYQYPCRLITLEVHSSLDAIGFLATITQALAAWGISVNPVSAYYHDHLFVPADRAEDAMSCLHQLVLAHRYDFQTMTIADEDIVWQMLMHAAHEQSLDAVKDQPELARYAAGWGRAGDMGVVALLDDQPVGAAWLRLWQGYNRGYGFVAEGVPELAIAVLSEYQNQGIGTQLLSRLLYSAREWYSAVSLNVRADNPVVRLYERLGFVKVQDSETVNRAGGVSFNMICQLEPLSK
ncbi:MAG TPA: ACT domain-containing protein [Leptolyngbyaceae cyanobacterium]